MIRLPHRNQLGKKFHGRTRTEEIFVTPLLSFHCKERNVSIRHKQGPYLKKERIHTKDKKEKDNLVNQCRFSFYSGLDTVHLNAAV